MQGGACQWFGTCRNDAGHGAARAPQRCADAAARSAAGADPRSWTV